MIASVRDVRRGLNPQTITEGGERFISDALRTVERRFEAAVGFGFTPQRRTLTLWDAWSQGRVWDGGRRLDLLAPLLAVEQIVNGGTGVLDATVYRLLPLHEDAPTPYEAVVLPTTTWTTDGSIEVSGVWGYHVAYADAWIDSLGVLDAPTNASVSLLGVDDADGPDLYGEAPRFSPGQLLRIDNEWLEVLTVDATADTLTVRRGVNGSTAAAHEAGATVFLWQADAQAVRAVTRWAGLLYARRDAYETATFDGVTAVRYPADAPEEVNTIIANLRDLLDPPFVEV